MAEKNEKVKKNSMEVLQKLKWLPRFKGERWGDDS